MPHDVADLPARSKSAEQYTESMNRWFRESLQNNRPWVETLIAASITQAFACGSPHLEGLIAAIGEIYAKERRLREKEIETLRKEVAALEQRLLTRPGRLPVARTWKPETVTYQAEFVSHDGCLWQAKKDTAQAPGGADWLCVARAGRDGADGRTPNIRGTYNAHKTYEERDMVALDGATFISKYHDPGICPGEGWQLLAQQGKRGHRGERGPAGPKGEKGDPVMPKIVSTKIDQEFNLSILRSDNSLEIIPLRAAFENYHAQTFKE